MYRKYYYPTLKSCLSQSSVIGVKSWKYACVVDMTNRPFITLIKVTN